MTYSIRVKQVGMRGAVLLLAAAALAGCGGGDEPVAPAAEADSVPQSAGASAQSFVDYQKGLAASDTAEPLKLQGFVPPADETSEPFSIG